MNRKTFLGSEIMRLIYCIILFGPIVGCFYNPTDFKIRKLKRDLNRLPIYNDENQKLPIIDFDDYITIKWDSIYIMDQFGFDSMIPLFNIVAEYDDPEDILYIIIKSGAEIQEVRIEKRWLPLFIKQTTCTNRPNKKRYAFHNTESSFGIEKEFSPYYGKNVFSLISVACLE